MAPLIIIVIYDVLCLKAPLSDFCRAAADDESPYAVGLCRIFFGICTSQICSNQKPVIENLWRQITMYSAVDAIMASKKLCQHTPRKQIHWTVVTTWLPLSRFNFQKLMHTESAHPSSDVIYWWQVAPLWLQTNTYKTVAYPHTHTHTPV